MADPASPSLPDMRSIRSFPGVPGSRPAHLLASCTALGLLTVATSAQAVSTDGSAALTSDYVWRGTTQTQGDPAVQVGVALAGDSGFYGSIWGSNVEFAPETHAGSEFDLTLGWAGALSNSWALDVNLLHYRYPSTTVDLNWTELNGRLAYADRYWLSLGYSPKALGSDDDGIYTQVGARFPAGEAFAFEAAAGYYALGDTHGDSYWHGQASAIWAVRAPFELRLTAHATDSAAKRMFGDKLAGGRIEAALQASF
ncbi:TorF family putative porin [Luteimonas sp. R10]|uniref:TorF family putative porin n=1 Tax=Luteimonas sp. R10 TaxID=3108176 RepID=UPI00308524B1|nr:TorF family putative porin [Luteimonas sp. R10]